MALPAIDLAETMVTAASRATGTALRLLMSGAHAACLAVRRSALRSHQRLRTDGMRCRRDVWRGVDRSGDALPAVVQPVALSAALCGWGSDPGQRATCVSDRIPGETKGGRVWKSFGSYC